MMGRMGSMGGWFVLRVACSVRRIRKRQKVPKVFLQESFDFGMAGGLSMWAEFAEEAGDVGGFEVETFDWVIGATAFDGGPVNDGSAAGDGVGQVRLLKDLFESGTGAAAGEELIASEF